ncbi:MAG: hypothetical protein Q4D98_08495 [Planctomycetia bacterium]|nr:hypothetical protein [Planctomycetia bacterium]
MRYFLGLWLLLAGTVFGGEYRGELSFFTNLYPHQDEGIATGETAAEYFQTPLAWDALSVHCPSYANDVGNLTLSLYRWKGSYADTVAEKPFAEKEFVDFRDNAHLKLDVETQPAGGYLWVLSHPVERVGVWKFPEAFSNTVSFKNGQRVAHSYFFTLHVTNAKMPFSGSFSLYEALWNEKTSPAPWQPDAQTPFVKRDLFADTWDAVDGLGRRMATHLQTGDVRPEKRVGLFYWTWHHWDGDAKHFGPYNNVEIAKKQASMGPAYHPHHWDEPMFGYYTTVDRWVLRKHAQMLATAGVDVVVFDATNGTRTWMDSTMALLETFAAARRDGVRTPQTAFMLPFGNEEWMAASLLQLYRDLYRDGKFLELWYFVDGKPLIHARPEAVTRAIASAKSEQDRADWEKILRFFTFRPVQPEYDRLPQRGDLWSWLEIYPQHPFGIRTDGGVDMMSVGVAQNYSLRKKNGGSGLCAMNDQNVFGRAYLVGEKGANVQPSKDPQRFLFGDNFQQQWNRVLDVNPDYVFITGWNEWIASRFPHWMGTDDAFPDQYSPEFSRDCEPSNGVLKDHFYCQMVDNIRRFKGTRPQRAADEHPIYRDYLGDTLPRDAAGYGKTHYTDRSGRNDLAECFVRQTADTISFTVESAAPLVDAPEGIRLFLSISDDPDRPHWEGVHFLVNREFHGKTLTLEKCVGGWKWEKIADLPFRVEGNRLTITIPRTALDQTGKIDLRFQWTDNQPQSGNPLDIYRTGDAAPDGRFTYRYFERKP